MEQMHLKYPQYRHKFFDEAVLINISSSKYGDTIKPGTFTLTDTSNVGDITIKDDGYGNLYASDATFYNDITGSNPSSSISS